MKSGFIAIIGKPNVGKSSLMNALVGEKISIVSPKAQTTRDRIMGVYTDDEHQMVFVDTPGVHTPKNALGEYMEKCVRSAVNGVDAIVIVLDVQKNVTDRDIAFIEKHLKIAPVYIVLNKTDLVPYERVYPTLQKLSPLLSGEHAVKEIIPTSCRRRTNIDTLKNYLISELKDETQYFDAEDVSDKPLSYMVCEIVREKALWLLRDEVPHGIGVILQSMQETDTSAVIEADIVCEKETHKLIVIGEDGAMLKEIGTRARADIEKLLGKKVYLKLFVKVRKDWRNRISVIRDVGYDDK